MPHFWPPGAFLRETRRTLFPADIMTNRRKTKSRLLDRQPIVDISLVLCSHRLATVRNNYSSYHQYFKPHFEVKYLTHGSRGQLPAHVSMLIRQEELTSGYSGNLTQSLLRHILLPSPNLCKSVRSTVASLSVKVRFDRWVLCI